MTPKAINATDEFKNWYHVCKNNGRHRMIMSEVDKTRPSSVDFFGKFGYRKSLTEIFEFFCAKNFVLFDEFRSLRHNAIESLRK